MLIQTVLIKYSLDRVKSSQVLNILLKIYFKKSIKHWDKVLFRFYKKVPLSKGYAVLPVKTRLNTEKLLSFKSVALKLIKNAFKTSFFFPRPISIKRLNQNGMLKPTQSRNFIIILVQNHDQDSIVIFFSSWLSSPI